MFFAVVLAWSRRLLVLVCLIWPLGAAANDWDAFDQPGVFALMRHALAPGVGDPAHFDLGDCATQRNLNAAGRAQARATGAAFAARGIDFDAVLTSQWCRSRDTADLLGLAPVQEVPAFNSFFAGRGDRQAQTAAARDELAARPGRVFVVSHQVNISALTGRGARSGEVLAVRAVDGRLEVLGSVIIDP